MRKRLAVGVSIPAVVLFVGLLVALLLPANLFVVTEALDHLGLLGARRRIDGLATPPLPDPPPLTIVHGTLWDAAGGARPNDALTIRGGVIAARGDTAPAGARVIDATGMTILPGFIDMHIHDMGGSFVGEMLAGNGVTSARDLGTQLAGGLRHREETAAGGRVGPRLFVAGPYLVGGAATSDQEHGVSGPASAAAVVGQFADAGSDWIKVHWGIDRETLRAVVGAAHARGLRVAAHLDGISAADAARAGVDTIEHLSGFDWSGPPSGETMRAEDELADVLLEHRVAITPTLVIAEHAFTLPDLARGDNPMLEWFPWMLRRMWVSSQRVNAGAAHLTPEEEDRRRMTLRRLQAFVGRFHRAGGRVLAGTDAPAFLVAPGFDYHRELELLEQSGLAREAVLEAATRSAAIALGRDDTVGRLLPGMAADLIIVDGDPIGGEHGIGVTRRVVLVAKDGRLLLDRLH